MTDLEILHTHRVLVEDSTEDEKCSQQQIRQNFKRPESPIDNYQWYIEKWIKKENRRQVEEECRKEGATNKASNIAINKTKKKKG